MPASRSPRRLLVCLVALMSLVASACGGGSESAGELRSSSLQPESASEPVPWNVEPAIAPAPEASEDTADASTVDRSAHSPGEDVPLTEVLALAFAAPESLSYTFTQGISMDMEMPGLGGFEIAPSSPVATGEVQGTRTHIMMDMGVLFEEMFADLGAGAAIPPGMENAKIEIWGDETTLVMDMSSFTDTLGAMDPMDSGEAALFADGPVRIDLSQLPGLTGSEFASQYVQGTQVVDPALLLQSLRSVDAIEHVGALSHNGRTVDQYDASITMAQYYDALGIDIAAQLDMVGGITGSAEDEAMFSALFAAMSDLSVELRILIDEEQLIRRLEVEIDMQPLMVAIFEDETVLELMAQEQGATVEEMGSTAAILGDMRYVVGTWQEFDNYGGALEIEFPEATDITSEFTELFGDLS